jgi:hypothetical protein
VGDGQTGWCDELGNRRIVAIPLAIIDADREVRLE